jgi:phage gpG-like protein
VPRFLSLLGFAFLCGASPLAAQLIESEAEFSISVFGPAEPTCADLPLGTVCADGAVYAGQNADGTRLYVAPARESGAFAWRPVLTLTAGATSLSDGLANTADLLASGLSHPAAEACRARGGGWYLPALDQLSTIYANNVALIGAGVTFASGYHWSSSQTDAIDARARYLTSTTTSATRTKSIAYSVHCVRDGRELDPGATATFSIPESGGRPRDALTVSAPVLITGRGTFPVTVSGEGSPEVSIDGGPFAASGEISFGQSLNVRLSAAPTLDTARTATVTIGGASADFVARTAPSCIAGPVGTVCADGAVYAGQNADGTRLYVAPARESGTFAWKPVLTLTAGATSLSDGLANTADLLASGLSHPAAEACRARGGGWYLPALNQMGTIYANEVALIGAGVTFASGYHWSSSQKDAIDAHARYLNGTTSRAMTKSSAYRK